jgi:hypothetical protein
MALLRLVKLVSRRLKEIPLRIAFGARVVCGTLGSKAS